MKTILLLLILFINQITVTAKTIKADEENLRVKVIGETLKESSTSGKLYKIAQKYNFKGELEYQLSWKKGGKLLSCKKIKSDTEHLVFLSRFQKELMKQKVKVKISKGEQLKMNYQFRFE